MKPRFNTLSLYSVLAIVLGAIILCFPSQCLSLSLNGLNLWFSKMIPALFPFMVLSGIIIRMNLVSSCVQFLMPLLGRLFRVGPSCIYGILIGFLCGFPMGARTAADLYEHHLISKDEASFLLSFCNNIGPVYFIGFVLPTLGISSPAIYLFAMYGLPFLYGLFLRYTIYSGRISPHSATKAYNSPAFPLLSALDESILSALSSITKLGGYMIFFNLLFILPSLLTALLPLSYKQRSCLIGCMGCLLEITGGIGLLENQMPDFVLCVLPFGGLSCIVQTYSMIESADLSLSEYVMHKMILTAVTVVFYFLAEVRFFLPG